MKRIGLWLVLALLVLTLAGCGEKSEPAASVEATATAVAPSVTLPSLPLGTNLTGGLGVLPGEHVVKNVVGPVAGKNQEIDLTTMSSTMVYSYVYNMMYSPAESAGKRFRIRGMADESYWDETDTTYHYVVIADATACCTQGLEFVLTDDSVQYPLGGSDVEISGTFERYDENGLTYFHIVADEMQILS
jgi:hypothetical protein